MKKILYILILALAVSFVMAQETDTQDKKKPTAGENVNEQKAPEPAKSEVTKTPQTSDTFTPSEEISEDLSVSFPVDI